MENKKLNIVSRIKIWKLKKRLLKALPSDVYDIFKSVPEKLKTKEIIQSAIELSHYNHTRLIYYDIPKEKVDRDIILAMLNRGESIYIQKIPEKHQTPEIITELIQRYIQKNEMVDNFSKIPESMQNSEKILSLAIEACYAQDIPEFIDVISSKVLNKKIISSIISKCHQDSIMRLYSKLDENMIDEDIVELLIEKCNPNSVHLLFNRLPKLFTNKNIVIKTIKKTYKLSDLYQLIPQELLDEETITLIVSISLGDKIVNYFDILISSVDNIKEHRDFYLYFTNENIQSLAFEKCNSFKALYNADHVNKNIIKATIQLCIDVYLEKLILKIPTDLIDEEIYILLATKYPEPVNINPIVNMYTLLQELDSRIITEKMILSTVNKCGNKIDKLYDIIPDEIKSIELTEKILKRISPQNLTYLFIASIPSDHLTSNIKAIIIHRSNFDFSDSRLGLLMEK